MSEFYYPELSYELIGLALAAHKAVGRFGKERDYASALEERMRSAGHQFARRGDVSGCRVNYVVEGKIAVLVRAKKYLLMDDYHKTRKALHALNLDLALVFNFKTDFLKPIRIIKGDRPPGAPLPTIEA